MKHSVDLLLSISFWTLQQHHRNQRAPASVIISPWSIMPNSLLPSAMLCSLLVWLWCELWTVSTRKTRAWTASLLGLKQLWNMLLLTLLAGYLAFPMGSVWTLPEPADKIVLVRTPPDYATAQVYTLLCDSMPLLPSNLDPLQGAEGWSTGPLHADDFSPHGNSNPCHRRSWLLLNDNVLFGLFLLSISWFQLRGFWNDCQGVPVGSFCDRYNHLFGRIGPKVLLGQRQDPAESRPTRQSVWSAMTTSPLLNALLATCNEPFAKQ